jgi:hypothetical protein
VRTAAQAVIAIVRASIPGICRLEMLNAEGISATNKK